MKRLFIASAILLGLFSLQAAAHGPEELDRALAAPKALMTPAHCDQLGDRLTLERCVESRHRSADDALRS